MKQKVGFGERVFEAIIYFVLIFLILVTVYPLVHVFAASLSEPSKLMGHKGLLIRPLGFSLESYKAVIENPNIINGFRNTLFIVASGVFIGVVTTALTAYVLSRKDLFWGKYVMFFIVFTMFFSGGMIPLYLIVKGLNLTNSLWATILPFSINTFNLIIMRTSFAGIPESLQESAKIDGAGHMTVLFRIVLPLSLPIVAVMILYYGVEKWNTWFYASIFLQDRLKYPLQIILREILLQNDTDSMMGGFGGSDRHMISETIKYSTVMVATIPILCVYPFLQKYFVKGVMVGAVKG